MTNEEAEQLVRELLRQQDLRFERHYGYLRHLMLMSGGTLAVLVSLNAGAGSTGMASALLRVALASLGLGILSGSVALYGEVEQQRTLALKMAAECIRVFREGSSGVYRADSVDAPFKKWMQISSATCYASLTFAALTLVAFALAR